MKTGFLVLLLALMPCVAIAEENPAVCKIVTQHKPADDVAYKAGVDVYGNAVVPADINAAPFQVPNIIKVPLDVDLAQRVNRLNDLGLQMEAPLGMLEIHQDGTIRYNDQDWTAPILTLCGESHKQTETANIPAQPKEQDRQPAPDAIKSPQIDNSNEYIEKIEAGMVSKAVEVSPTLAIPPQPVEMKISKEPEIIQGGEYKDFNYNE